MNVIYSGHRYALKHIDGADYTIIQFVQRPPFHAAKEGVTCQEVLRCLIDRVLSLDAETPWLGNQEVLHHLRLALVGFEARALIRQVESGKVKPEEILLNPENGHFLLSTQK